MNIAPSTTLTLDRVPAVSLAVDALRDIGKAASNLVAPEASVVLVADPGLGAPGIIATAEEALRRIGLEVETFKDIRSDPKLATVDAAAGIIRDTGAGLVVALGGGSALDVGKAAAAISSSGEAIERYALCADPFPSRAVRTICVPSTAGTGAEATRTAVFSDDRDRKLWFWGDALKPDLVILDPMVTVGLAPTLTAATGIDALVHAIEAATNANASSGNTMYCLEAIRLVTRHLPTAVRQPDNLAARAGLLLAATLAGIAIDNSGTAIAHCIGHALAALRPIHHGRAVGLGMLATLEWNIGDDDGSYVAVAQAMGLAGGAREVPGAFERLLREVGIKVSLAGDGHDIATPQILAEHMLKPENRFGIDSNRRPVGRTDVLRFAETMLTQS